MRLVPSPGNTPSTRDGALGDRLLRAGDARLEPAPRVARAAAFIAALHADTPRLETARWRTLAFLQRHPDALLRSCAAGHLTASALVVDATCTRALLLRHKKLGRWLQPGGHADGDGNLVAVALREALEETGAEALVIDTVPVDLDIHAVAPPGEPQHLHFDLRFLARAPARVEVRCNHESEALRWASQGELSCAASRAAGGIDESTGRLAARGFARARTLWPSR